MLGLARLFFLLFVTRFQVPGLVPFDAPRLLGPYWPHTLPWVPLEQLDASGDPQNNYLDRPGASGQLEQ